ncbi:DNA-3-methyladenine glycosylase [Evansella cellulosilytica]|nr:DNA-3-methyladenine glycosylase [Evansella cellulosilytica]
MDKRFFKQSTLQLAINLLGKTLVKESDAGVTAGKIVETEAYKGPHDRAAHSFNNRRTKRTEVMFGPSGYTYTYVMHTHCLVNVVSAEVGQPEAVLIRAIEPLVGIDLILARRGEGKALHELTNGPGKLTKAMGIDITDYGLPLFEKPLFIADGDGIAPEEISKGPRIGIENSGEAKDYPWRFWIANNQFVSRYRRKK